MNTAVITAFSVTGWFTAVAHELVDCFNHMNMTQWAIVASCAVAFGFLCLKGTAIDR